jgi:hypothetical protein
LHRPVLIALIAALAACGTSSREGQAGQGSGSDASAIVRSPVRLPSVKHYTPDTVRTMKAPPIALPKQESFRLLDRGKGARRTLRYQLAPGVIELRNETRLSSRQLDAKGVFGDAVAMPPIRDGFAITVSRDQPGILAIRVLEGEIAGTATPAAQQYVAAWKARLENRRVSVAVDPRGQLGTITFNDDPANQRSATAKDELAQRLLALLVPLPAEPVGSGAKWQVTTILRQGPAYVKQTADYTLGARVDGRWKIHVRILRVAEQQLVADPNLPPGTTAELLAMFRLFEGDVIVDLARPVIERGTLSVESRLHAKLTPRGQPAIEQFLEDLGTVTFSTKTP